MDILSWLRHVEGVERLKHLASEASTSLRCRRRFVRFPLPLVVGMTFEHSELIYEKFYEDLSP